MNPQQNNSSERGFTIIEVVLVLAIAGLIFLMVFIALPALQRSQRDTQRRDDLARVSQALTQYQTNNNGRLPSSSASASNTALSWEEENEDGKTTVTDTTSFRAKYLTNSEDNFRDPLQADGEAYAVEIIDATSEIQLAHNTYTDGDTDAYKITINIGAVCSGESPTRTGAQKRNYAVVYNLEGSGTYCADNK